MKTTEVTRISWYSNTLMILTTVHHLYGAAKRCTFYAGASNKTLLQLFPPPKYEMPNDFLFEFTGVGQAVVLVPLLVYFLRLTKNILLQTRSVP